MAASWQSVDHLPLPSVICSLAPLSGLMEPVAYPNPRGAAVLVPNAWSGGGTDGAGPVPDGYNGSGCGVLAPAHDGVDRVALVGSFRVALLLEEPMTAASEDLVTLGFRNVGPKIQLGDSEPARRGHERRCPRTACVE